jgi:RHS repeat-associated protein
LAQTYARLPLIFEANVGQTDAQAQFITRGGGFNTFLTATGPVLELPRPVNAQTNPTGDTFDVVSLHFIGAATVKPVGVADLLSRSNYFIGGSSFRDVPNFAQLVYPNYYAHTNLVYQGDATNHLEYQFVIAPGASPSIISMQVQGAQSVTINTQGNLVITTPGGTLVHTAPKIFQTVNGVRVNVGGGYVLSGSNLVSFQVGTYDASQPLTIDPTLTFSTYLGGSGTDVINGIAVDGAGNSYLAGSTSSLNFPGTSGTYAGNQDAFVTKLSPDGKSIIYSTYVGSPAADAGQAIAVDAAGNAYLTGSGSYGFPTTSGAYQGSNTSWLYGGGTNAFVTKLNAAGDNLVYSTMLGGSGAATGYGIAVNAAGNAYVTGSTANTGYPLVSFPTTAGAYQTTYGGGSTDAFITEFDPSGSTLVYSTFLGGSGTDSGAGIALDYAGNAYVTGSTASTNFATTTGAFQTSLGGGSGQDAFVTKLNAGGSTLGYSTYLGGSGTEQGMAIALGYDGSAYVTGSTTSTDFPTANAYQSSLSGGSGQDAFVTKLTPSGNALTYSTYLGGSGTETGRGIAVDSSGKAVVVGDTSSTNFPTLNATQGTFGGGSNDAFVTQFTAAGNALTFSTYLGGSGSDQANAVALDIVGNAYVGGSTTSTNFPTANAEQGSNGGGTDGFVTKFGIPTPPPVITGISPDTGSSSTDNITTAQNISLTGTSVANATITVSRSGKGVIGTTPANSSGNWTFDYTATTLAEGTYSFTATATLNGSTSQPSVALLVTVDKTAATVQVALPASTTSKGPSVQVNASDLNSLPDGTAVAIDVDTNNDGNFTDAGETNYASGTLRNGFATIKLPTLPGTGTYGLQVRLTDLAGNQVTTTKQTFQVTAQTNAWNATGQVLSADPVDDQAPQLAALATGKPLGGSLAGLFGGLTLGGGGSPLRGGVLATHGGLPGSGSSGTAQGIGDPGHDPTQQPGHGTALGIGDPGRDPNNQPGHGTAQGTGDPGHDPNNQAGHGTAQGIGDPGHDPANQPGHGTTLATGDPGHDPNNQPAHGAAQGIGDPGHDPKNQPAPGAALGTGDPGHDPRNQPGHGTALGIGDPGHDPANQPGHGTTIATGDPGHDPNNQPGHGTAFGIGDPGHDPANRPGHGAALGLGDPGHDPANQPGHGVSSPTGFGVLDGRGQALAALQAGGQRGGIAQVDPRGQALLNALGGGGRGSGPISIGGPGTGTRTVGDPVQGDVQNIFGGLGGGGPGGAASIQGGVLGMLGGITGTDGTGQDPLVSGGLGYQAGGDSPLNRPFMRLGAATSFSRPLAQLGDLQAGHALDLDGSPGIGQSGFTNLVYNSNTVSVQPIVQATIPTDNASGVGLPPSITATLTWDLGAGQTITAKSFVPSSSASPGDVLTLAVQTTATASTTRRYPWKLDLSMNYGTPITRSITGAAYVVAQGSSALGTGWSLSDVDQLIDIPVDNTNGYPAGKLRVYGSGGWRFYSGTGPFTSPAGDPGTLVKNLDGSFTYSTPDGWAWNFNSSGYQISIVSPDGLATITFRYDGSNRLIGITGIDGAPATFTYGTGLATIVAYNNRTTTLTLNSGNLAVIANPDGGLHSFTYDASAHLTQELFGSLQNNYAYSASGAVATITFGSSTSPSTLAVAPAALQGLAPASGNGTPAIGSALASVTDPANNTAGWVLDPVGRLIQQIASDGGITQWQRNSSGYVTLLTDPLNRVTTFQRDSAGYITQETLPDGTSRSFAYQSAFHALATFTNERNQTVTYGYDTLGHLTRATNPLGQASAYSYAASGLLTALTDALGHTTTLGYDSSRRLTFMIDPIIRTTTYQYDSNGNLWTIIDPTGGRTTVLYDVMGRLTQLTDPLGNLTSWTYDPSGLQLTLQDPLGRQTSIIYDTYNRGLPAKLVQATGAAVQRTRIYNYSAAERLTSSRDGDAAWTSLAYDPTGRPQQSIDPTGSINRAVYDWAGQLGQQVGSLGGLIQSAYTSRGFISSFTDALGDRATYAYDAVGNLTAVTDGLNHTSTFAYDALNHLIGVTQAAGTAVQRSFTLAYDAIGELTSVTDFLGNTTSMQYDPVQRMTLLITAAGTPVQQVATMLYDVANNLTSWTDPLGNIATYAYDAWHRLIAETEASGASQQRSLTVAYDAAGRATSQTDWLGLRTGWAYDAQDRLTAVTEASGSGVARTTTLLYDTESNQAAVVNALGWTTQTAHDAAGRPVLETGPRGNQGRMLYDAAGNLTATVDPLGNQANWVYDSGNRPVQWQDALGHLATWAYDALGDLIAQADQLGQRTTISWDPLQRMTQVQDPLGRLGTVVYDAASRVQATVDPLGRRTSFAYDALNRLTQTTDALNNLSTMGYDAIGHMTLQIDARGNRATFSYDTLGRLTQLQDALGHLASVVYDADNNVLAAVDPVGHRTTFAYDGLNRPTQWTDALNNLTTFAYDAVNNLTSLVDPRGGRTTLNYDVQNRLTQSADALNNLTTFSYDADSNLQALIDPRGNRSSFVYDGLNRLIQTQDALNNLSTLGYDAIGRMTQLIDARGNALTMAYDAASRLTQWTDALNNLSTFAYDGADNLTLTIDARGNRSTLAYDALNRLTQAQDALTNLSTLVYDAVGNVQATVDARSNRTTFAYDAINQLTQTTDALNNLWTTVYDSASNIQVSIDARGNRTTYAYDNLNRLTQTTDALNNLWTLAYDAASNTTLSIDPRGNRTTLAYDLLNRLTQQTDALGNLSTVVYDPAGNIQATADPRGNRTTFAYDADNRRTQVTGALNNLSTVVYDAVNNVLAQVDPRGNRTTFAYDASNRATQWTDALGNLWTAIYDAADNLIGQVDPLNHRTSFAYDALNRRTTTTDALNHTTTLAYDATSNLIASTNPRGFTTSFVYDALNRLTQTQDALSDYSTIIYDAASNVLAQIDPRGNRTTFGYDALNRVTQTTDALNHLTTVVFDSAGNVSKRLNALGYATTFAYDALNRRTAVTEPTGGILTQVFDTAGNRTASTDQLAHTTTFAYDAANRLTATTDARNFTTTQIYDAASNLLALVDPVGNRTTYAYDALNRATQETDPFGNNATLAYDAAGRKTSSTDRLGQRISLAYDAANRLTGQTWLNASGGTANLFTFTYDNADNLLTAANYGGAYTFAYDAIDRQTVVQEPFGQTLTYSYDAASNLTLTQDSFGGVFTSLYDAVNRLTSRQFNGGAGSTTAREDLAYSARDQVTTITRYSDVAGSNKVGEADYTHDQAGMLTNLQHKNGSGGILANYTYTYDLAHRVVTETYNGNATNYGYDAANQLTSAGALTYAYDGAGNRTLTGYQTGTANRMTNDGTWTYTYDAQGNLIKKSKGTNAETLTFTYDNANRLIGMTDRATDGGSLNSQATYVYDALGNRAEKDVNAGGTTTVTRVAYDQAGNAWADLNGSSSLTTRRIYLDGTDSEAARIVGTVTAWYLPDRLGSIRNMTDGSGNLSDTITYDAFGKVTNETSPTTGDRYKFTGRELDSETGLQYHHARYYDPATGRWTTDDPSGFAAGDPNLYRYVQNGPTNSTDPSGLSQDGMPWGTDPALEASPPPYSPPMPGSIDIGDPHFNVPMPDAETIDPGFEQPLPPGGIDALLRDDSPFAGNETYERWRHSGYYDAYMRQMEISQVYKAKVLSELEANPTPQAPGPPGGWQQLLSLLNPIDQLKLRHDIESALWERARLEGIGSALKAELGILVDGLRGANEGAKGLLEGAKNTLSRQWDGIQRIWNDPWGYIKGHLIETILDPGGAKRSLGLIEGIIDWAKRFDENPSEAAGEVSTQALEAAAAQAVTDAVLARITEPSRLLPAPKRPRLPQDIAVDPTPPPARVVSSIGKSAAQDAALQRDIQMARAMGARDIRVNQHQVNAAGQRVGINKPDLQYTLPDGTRVYIEYDSTTPSTFPNTPRGPAHAERILANDPRGVVILKVIP